MIYKSDIDVQMIQDMGGDHMVVAAAKVSTSGEECLKHLIKSLAGVSVQPVEKQLAAQKGLINYLMKHRHGTPFEHSAMTFYVYAPIFVWREWHRHRIGFSYNEESGRYKTLEPVFYIPDRERPMIKIDPWKPGSPKFARCESDRDYNKLINNLKASYALAYVSYQDNLSMNIDPGLARDCLPVGIYSGCWVTCNPRSLMAFLSLRTHHLEAKFVSYPLWEIEMAANKVEEMFAKHFPITYQAFVDNGRVGP